MKKFLLIFLIIFCFYLIKKKEAFKNPELDININIVHYTPLKNRYKNMKKQLDKYGYKYNFITNFDRENITEEQFNKFDDKLLKSKGGLAKCANFLAHLECFKMIENSPYKYNLILEDDAILEENFDSKLKLYLSQLPSDYDLLYIGTVCNLHIPKNKLKKNKFIYYKDREPDPRPGNIPDWGGLGATRAADSYFISKKCAKKLNIYFKNKNNIDKIIDHYTNFIIRELKLNVYWAEPTIVKQGSHDIFKKSY